MFWIIPVLFAVSAIAFAYALLNALQDANESYSSEYTADTARQFEDLFLFISPSQMLRITRILSSAVFCLLFFGMGNLESKVGLITGSVAGLFGALGVAFMQRGILKFLKVRRLERFNGQLVDALTSMSNALKAGFSIQQAFESVVNEGANPIAQEFAMFLQQLRVGVTFEEAIADLDERVGSEDLSLMIQAVEIARQTGGNLTEVFDRIAGTIRERRRIEGKINSLTAQGKIQGRVVGAMPFLLGLALYFLEPTMMVTFFKSLPGMIVVAVIIVMQICGGFVIRKIVNIDV